MTFLDLGCAGGGMVLDAILRGHLAIGLEGSDYSLIRQRKEWRLLRNNLFTCDITKPFAIEDVNGVRQQFDIITAWEVLEHIQETDFSQLLDNVSEHLKRDGFFVVSVSTRESTPSKYGVNLHVTIHPKEWWIELFRKNGFVVTESQFELEDMARGGCNPSNIYQEEKPISGNDEDGFWLALRKSEVAE